MRDDSDAYERNNGSDEEFYPVRGRRARHIVRMNTMQRRTALSLRPISQKSYAEMISPHFNSESEEVVIRRSKRKKQKNMSWLADSQMHKVGYPNLDADSSDESSRDAVVDTRNEITITKRTTRRSADPRSVRETKPPQYLYDYQKDIPTRRRIKQIPVVDEESPNVRKQESNDKENRRLSTKPKAQKVDDYVESKESSSSTNIVIPKEKKEETQVKKEAITNDTKQAKQNGKDKDQSDGESSPNKPNQNADQSSGDEREQEIPLSRLRPICKRRRKPSNFFSAKPRDRKDSDSSSTEEEENRRYLLRDRPKQNPQKRQTFYLKTNSRKYKRGRRSSTSDSSSDGKYVSKQPKGQHSKNEKMKSVAAGSTNFDPIKPEILDSSVRFSSVGGLDGHIQCLKEMVLLPMMYPEVFKQFKIKAPKGVLFHGPPGTGKTLLARALANECSFGTRKVSFFQRKGADLLSKWVGESEKQLRMLFEKAAQSNPSIIFFDELDGLASARSSRQDQYHTSIVSTFLALMDGLEDRGEVIVIGATNRIDNIDPAFRRPGRFDRELFFPLPTRNEREEIINVHTSFWESPPNSKVLSYLAEHTNGYCGSDLRALCSEAVIQSFRRLYPQVYNSEVKLLVDAKNVKVETVDFMRAKSLLVPASERISQGLGQKLYPILKPLLQASLETAKEMVKHTFPHGLNSSLAKVKLSPNMRPAQLMITANGTNHGQNHLASALLFSMEHVHSYLLGLSVLYQETARGQEETCIKILDEVRKNVPSILYIPDIDEWWQLTSEVAKAILKGWLAKVSSNVPILLLATAKTLYEDLPEEVQDLFSKARGEIMTLCAPNEETRRSFYKPLIIDASLRAAIRPRERPKTPPPLAKAPTPPPTPMSEDQIQKLYDQEEHTLRELRIFLRDICKKLANNKLFFMFTKPVDTEEVPDYTNIIKQPMDLETMMTKVDLHRYECAKDFLADIELICQNALEYNPAKTSADKQIRHRACSLRDYAYTLIKTEMDTDFEDKCQNISVKRRAREYCPTKYLPPYINTLEDALVDKSPPEAEKIETVDKSSKMEEQKITPSRKRKRWQRGILTKRKRKTTSLVEERSDLAFSDDNDESKEEVQVEAKEIIEQNGESSKSDTNVPLTINCDPPKSDAANEKNDYSLLSPRRRLGTLLSPSELLDYHLDFDDIEEAQNDAGIVSESSPPIECDKAELETILNNVISMTEDLSLGPLLDLYNNLSRIIKQYSTTHERSNLPKELSAELVKFKMALNIKD